MQDGRINLHKAHVKDGDALSLIVSDAAGKQYQINQASIAEKEEWKRVLTELTSELNSKCGTGPPLAPVLAPA